MRIIAGESRGRKLRGVRRGGTRPTMERVRESLFGILTRWIAGASFLDLFAGTGSVGLEALSRGAARAVFVDANYSCAMTIRENLGLMDQQEHGMVLARPWQSGLNQLSARGDRFDMIFADPPYEEERVLLAVAERIANRELLLPGGWLIFQHSIRLILPDELAPGLHRTDSRRFGETLLTFYRWGAGV